MLLSCVLSWAEFTSKGGKKKGNQNVVSEVVFVRNHLKVQGDCFNQRPIKINLFCLLSKMAGLITLDGGPVTNIASRCRYFGDDFRVEIGGNVLAALPNGRRFEDATETGFFNQISQKKKKGTLKHQTLTICLRG